MCVNWTNRNACSFAGDQRQIVEREKTGQEAEVGDDNPQLDDGDCEAAARGGGGGDGPPAGGQGEAAPQQESPREEEEAKA